jgi:hypothetical protein
MTKKSVTTHRASRKNINTEGFLHALRCTNPFSKNRVSGAADFEADVPTIHGKEFDKLVKRVHRVAAGGASSGLLIVGSAGVGKSHLLGRLARWAQDDGAATVLFLHNIVASPERLPRYLLCASVSVLAGLKPEAYGKSALHRLLWRAILQRTRKKAGPGARLPAIEPAARTLQAIVREVDGRGDVARALGEFYRFCREGGDDAARDRARAAVQWLSGESIEKGAADALHLTSVDDEGAALADDAEVELVFRALAHVGTVAGHPIVLCVDQVDNLDHDKVRALSAFLQVLIDHAERMLIIVSGIKETMLAFEKEGIISKAAWDRIAQHQLALTRIDEPDARALIHARVEQFAAPFEGLATVNVKRRADELFPLDASWLQNQLAQQTEFRPRDVITWARDRWEQQQDRLDEVDEREWMRSWPGKVERREAVDPDGSLEQAIDGVTAAKLTERINERILQPDALPPDADNLATLSASLLELCRGREQYSIVDVKRSARARGRRIPAYDLLVHERGERGAKVATGVLFLSADNAVKATHALQRLVDDTNPPDHRILVTDEERRPLRLGPRGKQHLAALRKLGKDFHHCDLRLAGHAALDALYGLIASARVGDLEVEYPRGNARRISEVEAIESLHRQAKFAEQPLLRELLTEEAGHNRRKQKEAVVDEKRAKETIQAHLAWRLCLTSREITEEFIEIEHLESAEFETVHGQIKSVAQSMHAQGFLHATAVDTYLYLQLMPRGQSAQWT